MSIALGLLPVVRRPPSWLLLGWRARDLTLNAFTGQAASFDRADVSACATLVDTAGRVSVATAKQPRFGIDRTGGAFGLLLEGARKNACLQNSNFGATWTLQGTPTRTAAAAAAGAIVLDLLGDDSAAAIEGYVQAVACTGNGSKAFSLDVRQAASSSSRIQWTDATAAADRLKGHVTWAAGTPIVNMQVGTYLGFVTSTDQFGFTVHRLLFVTSTVTAANTNNVIVYPAVDNAGDVTAQGTLYVGAVQVEDAPFPSSRIITGAAAVTRAADTCSWSYKALPQALTLYGRCVNYQRTGGAGDSDNGILLGSVTNANARFGLFLNQSAGAGARALHTNAAAGTVQTAALADPAYGVDTELLAWLFPDGSVQAQQRVIGGALTQSAVTAANALAAAWHDATLSIGAIGPGGDGNALWLAVGVGMGAVSMDTIAAAVA